MRRGSLIGPLLILLIGVVFLMNTLRPDLPLLEVAAKYWPYLLVVWGGLRLLEVVAWYSQGRPLPASGVSGGEWALAVIIALAGSGLYIANFHRPWQHMGVFAAKRIEMFGHPYDYSIPEQRQQAGKTPRVVIENLRGNARVVVSTTDEVVVSGRKTIRAMQESDAARVDRQSPLEVAAHGDMIVIRTNQDRVTGEARIATDLEVAVPKGASIQGRGREGDFDISGLEGVVEITSDNAGVRLENIAGNVRLDLRRSDLVRALGVKGSVELLGGRGRDLELENIEGQVTVSASYSGEVRLRKLAKPLRMQNSNTDLRVEKLPGEIELDLGDLVATDVVGPMRFNTKSRDVQIDRFTNSIEITIDRGDINLRPAEAQLGQIQAQTREGELQLDLPESAKFELKAVTDRGEVHNDFGPALREYAERNGERRGATLEGAVGNGPLISLNTRRGSIVVRKDSGPLEAPQSERPRVRVRSEKGEIEVH